MYLPQIRFLLVVLIALLGTPVLPVGAEELALIGKGTRNALFIKLYTCEILAAVDTGELDELLNADVPAMIRIQVHGEPPDAMPGHWKAAIDAELNDKFMRLVNKNYQGLEADDQVTVRYAPGQGTDVSLNGEVLFNVPGRNLMDALLDQWLGPQPVSRAFREELLNNP